jgi:hypothetical protein
MLLKSLRGERRHGIKGPVSQTAGASHDAPSSTCVSESRGAPLFAIWKTARPLYRRVPV